jgi:hypothetical protein
MVTTGNQEGQRLAQRRIDEIFSEASNATGTIRDVETALAVLRDPETGQPRIATGQSIPAQVVRGVSRYLGINVNGTTPERLDVLQAYLGNLSAEQRADLLRGLQPISNAEFQSANQALATMATDPNALVTLLEIQKSAARRQVELAAALRQENVTDLVSRGAVRAWEFDWRRRALEQNSGPRVEDTGNQQPPRLAPASVRRNDDGTIVYIPPGQRGQQDPPPPPPPPAPAPTTSPQPQPAEPPPGVNPEVWRRFQGLGLPPR